MTLLSAIPSFFQRRPFVHFHEYLDYMKFLKIILFITTVYSIPVLAEEYYYPEASIENAIDVSNAVFKLNTIDQTNEAEIRKHNLKNINYCKKQLKRQKSK